MRNDSITIVVFQIDFTVAFARRMQRSLYNILTHEPGNGERVPYSHRAVYVSSKLKGEIEN